MHSPMNRNSVFGYLGLAGILLAGCQKNSNATSESGSPTGNAVVVNGDAISLADFYEHMAVKQTATVMTRQGPSQQRLVGSFGLQSLQEVVDQKLLLQMAKEQGVLPTDADVDAELKFQTDLRKDYVSVLEDQGLTMELIRHELLVGLARNHLIMKGVTVDPADVNKYVKDHPEKYSDPARATLLYIQVSTEAEKAKVDGYLAKGSSFGAVAQQLSRAPRAKETGGLYATDIVSQMAPPLQDLVKVTPTGHSSPWISNSGSFFKFFVGKKSEAKAKTPSAAELEFARRTIALEKGELKNDFDHTFIERLHQAKVDVEVPYLKDPWKKWNQMSGGTGVPKAAAGN